MTSTLSGEQWKSVVFDFEFTNEFRLEVSNFGRVRTFNKLSKGNILKGSMINGYPVVKLKLFRPRDFKSQAIIENLEHQIALIKEKLQRQIQGGANEAAVGETTRLLQSTQAALSKRRQQDLKERTINYHALIHRLVATYFLPTPTPDQTVVAHLDYNKLNNRATNLKWMTPEENYAHQQSSPLVIKDKEQRSLRQRNNGPNTKLTITRVMLLKKLLQEGKPMKQLVKLFKVTETQIIRIKRGENWVDVPAAT